MSGSILEIHVPLCEIAGPKVEVLAIEGHEFRQEEALHLLFGIFEMIAINEDAPLGGVAV